MVANGNLRAVDKTWIGLLGSDRIGLRIGSDWQFALNSRQKWSRDIPRNEDGGEKSMYRSFSLSRNKKIN